MKFSARLLFDGLSFLKEMTVVVEAGVICELRPWQVGDPDWSNGTILPGLVNAHTHIELSSLKGAVPGGSGLANWVADQYKVGVSDTEASIQAGIDALSAAGTAFVCDLCNGNSDQIAAALVSSGISGVVQRELLTLDADKLPERIAMAYQPDRIHQTSTARVVIRPSPHALYSTAPDLVTATVLGNPHDAFRPPASIHLAEDMDELKFLNDGTGAWANFLNRLGLDWNWWQPPGCSPVTVLEQLGVLSPDLLLVHGVYLSASDRMRIANSGATVVLCPRSNRYIHGELPDVLAMIAADIPIALGTDSMASCPNLDVLGEVTLLMECFPSVDPVIWLRAATTGGARALRCGAGRIEVGRSPGLISIDADEIDKFAAAKREKLVPARWEAA